MLFKKKVEHKKYCPRCGATDDLLVYTRRKDSKGVLRVYYLCRPCNRERTNKYYHAGNQQKFMDANKRWRDKQK